MLFVALLNLGYFGVEFAVALSIGSVSLFADSIDLHGGHVGQPTDPCSTALAFEGAGTSRYGPGWRPARTGLGHVLSDLEQVQRANGSGACGDEPGRLSASGVNLTCELLLTRYRQHRGSLTVAAFLSARNDTLANIAIIAAGVFTALTRSIWPDLLVGLIIRVMNAGAAGEVWQAAYQEHRAAKVTG